MDRLPPADETQAPHRSGDQSGDGHRESGPAIKLAQPKRETARRILTREEAGILLEESLNYTEWIGGGVPIESAGSLVAAVGVSGAPGGQADDDCARVGIEAIQDLLEF